MTSKYICIILFLIVGVKAEIEYADGLDEVPGNDEGEEWEVIDTPVTAPVTPQGRYYSLSTCDYKATPGYTCIGCMTALHCYATSLAVVVDCRGLFRYCRDGHCSMFKDDRCLFSANNSSSQAIRPSLGDKENITTVATSESLLTTHSSTVPIPEAQNEAIEDQSATVTLSDIKTATENPKIVVTNEIDALFSPAESNGIDVNSITDDIQLNRRLDIYSGLKNGALGDYSEISSVPLKRDRRN